MFEAMPNWLLHSLDSVEAVCSDYCLHFWEVVGSWIAGLGTLAAVAVCLWLSRRQGPRLRVSADIFVIIQRNAEPPHPEVVSIDVRNIGERECIIEGIGWRVGHLGGADAASNGNH